RKGRTPILNGIIWVQIRFRRSQPKRDERATGERAHSSLSAGAHRRGRHRSRRVATIWPLITPNESASTLAYKSTASPHSDRSSTISFGKSQAEGDDQVA